VPRSLLGTLLLVVAVGCIDAVEVGTSRSLSIDGGAGGGFGGENLSDPMGGGDFGGGVGGGYFGDPMGGGPFGGGDGEDGGPMVADGGVCTLGDDTSCGIIQGDSGLELTGTCVPGGCMCLPPYVLGPTGLCEP
jgi:hypothetical protein